MFPWYLEFGASRWLISCCARRCEFTSPCHSHCVRLVDLRRQRPAIATDAERDRSDVAFRLFQRRNHTGPGETAFDREAGRPSGDDPAQGGCLPCPPFRNQKRELLAFTGRGRQGETGGRG